ncbi:MAG TPA: hypothetical protein DDZ39_12845 [Flavobacteriaceae bacterium]|nr:hypothetical protein [Flavobacteriaceae bacterium]HBS11394.1 hypothetical protein [Flavobacteriaceae bacterium]
MSCQHCCGANLQFDIDNANNDLKRYLKKGPKKMTRMLVDALKKEDIKNLSLLDIGGGIGPIPLELISKGLQKITDVDASQGYISVATAELKKRKLSHLANYHLGDFVALSNQIETHDIVTLDKVICCYPDVHELLKTSLSKANQYYGLVYPQAHILSRIVVGFLNFKLKLKKNPFRTFIHDPKLVHDTITSAGFQKIYSGKTLLSWQIHLYKKEAS